MVNSWSKNCLERFKNELWDGYSVDNLEFSVKFYLAVSSISLHASEIRTQCVRRI